MHALIRRILRRPPRTKRARGSGDPAAARHVVLVPGIWDTFRTMRRMEKSLHDAGFLAFTAGLSPNDGRADLDTLAVQLRDQIARRIPPGEKFSIVGFSMGGLVARSYLRQFGHPGRLDAFVSISSPHRGTWTAWLRNKPGIRDMRPGSEFLAAVDRDAARYAQSRWTTIRTPLDLIILPARSSVIPWARNHAVLVLVHPFMAWDGRVIRRVIAALDPGFS